MARRGNRRESGIGPMIGVAAITALVSIAATMAITGGRNGPLAGVATDVTGAVGSVVSMPVRWFNSTTSAVGSFFGGSSLNAQLKAENQALLQWRDQAKAMAERLDAYEKLHNIKGEPLPEGVAGRLVAESTGPFSRAGVVNVGAKSGVKVNWIVINQNGLVGRVISVGAQTSRVLMLSDGDSRVPVMGEVTRARAIASGDKTPAPRLAHLNTPALMRDGEQVMTSGDDGIFPRGIAVGQAGIAPDKQWRLRLSSKATPIDFVRLVPPSNFPPPLDPVTAPSLAPAPTQGEIMPLASGAAAVPTAATPEAIRAAQLAAATKTSSEAEAAKALAKRLAGERDAAREALRKADAARKAATETVTVKAEPVSAPAATTAPASSPTPAPSAPAPSATEAPKQ